MTDNDTTKNESPAATAPPSIIRQELCWLLLIVLVFAANFLVHPTGLTVRGEESRRARIAWEMLHNGDWVVSRLQGEPRLTRPPLHYWAIAVAGYLHGQVDAWSMRLPSFLSVLATAFLVYWYVRQQTSAPSAFLAAVAVMTFGQVLQLGRLGESDATFMFLFSASLLIWHGGRNQKWSPWCYQLIAYTLVAAATLTKGPQAPIYFAATVGLYLLGTRNWKELFSPAHLTGVLLCIVLVNYWHYLFLQQLTPKDLYVAYFGEVGKRFTDHSSFKYLLHLLQYPLEVLSAGLFPWSILLCAFLLKPFRQHFSKQRFNYGFSLLAICVAWPTVWLPASSNTRYFICLFPCVAVILGYVTEALIIGVKQSDLSLSTGLNRIWLRFNRTLTFALSACVIAMFIMKIISPQHILAHETVSLILLTAGTILMINLLLKQRHLVSLQVGLLTLCWGLLIGVTVNGPVYALMSDRSNNAEEQVAHVHAQIPSDQQLVSLGLNHHLFTLYWNDDLPIVRPDPVTHKYPEQLEYFCYHNPGNKPIPDFGFRWKEIARVNCDRNIRNNPYDIVIVGKVEKSEIANSKDTTIR